MIEQKTVQQHIVCKHSSKKRKRTNRWRTSREEHIYIHHMYISIDKQNRSNGTNSWILYWQFVCLIFCVEYQPIIFRSDSLLISLSHSPFVLLLVTHWLLKVVCALLFIHFNKISSECRLNTSLKLKCSFIVFILKESDIDSTRVN